MQVHTVLVPLQYPGVVSNAVYRGDLVFLEEAPVLVLEWAGERGVSAPSLTVPLDPACLTPGEHHAADYVHADPVLDPRPKPDI